MSSTVNIVELIDGKYILNKKELCSIISLAQDCDSIAMISIVGQKFCGKTFLMNCLMSYLESNDKNNWPLNASLVNKYGFHDNNTNPVIQLCSKPFIIKDGDGYRAIFLMDSSKVFIDYLEISKTELMKDIIGLFMYTSSTIIHIKRKTFKSQDLKQLRECLKKNLDFINDVDKFQEIFFYIQDWDTNTDEKEHLLGSKWGKVFFEKESDGLDFQRFFNNIECYLMPPPGENVKSFEIDLPKLNSQFIIQLSQMIKMKLLNIRDMEIKRKPHTDQPIRPDELIELFESYINKLNADPNYAMIDILPDRMSNLKIGDQTTKSLDNIVSSNYNKKYVMDETQNHIHTNDENMDYEHFDVIEEITQTQISTNCEHLLNELKFRLENAVKDPNFDFQNGFSKVFDKEVSESMSDFYNQFKNRISPELYENNMEQLTNNVNHIKNQFKEKVNHLENKLKNDYKLEIYASIKFYDKEMNVSIEHQLEVSAQELDLDEIDNQIQRLSLESFAREVKKIDGFNNNLLIDFNIILKNDLTHRKKKYETALDLIKSYRNEWKEYLNKYRFIEASSLMRKQESLLENFNLSLNKLEYRELELIIHNLVVNIFNSIKVRNKQIGDDEEALANDVINFVYRLFYECMYNKLKSRFYSQQEVKKLNDNLLAHTLQTMITHCDFRKYQNHLIEKCKNDLRSKLDRNYIKFSSSYLESVAKAQTILKKARDEAITMYCSEMKKKLSENCLQKQNEFEAYHSIMSRNALKLNEDSTDCLKKDFDQLFFGNLVSENITYITQNINMHKDKLVEQNQEPSLNSSNVSVEQKQKYSYNSSNVSCISIYFGRNHLSAAYYDKDIQYILDKNGNKFRANSIAINDDILVGNEARAYYDLFDEEPFDKNFDIKQLIAKNRESTRDELLSYPFKFSGENLRVKVNNKLINHEFSIESLIALQILDIQLDAQKLLGKFVTNAVLTVPTRYNFRQRDAFRDVANIAGLDQVYILSEMNAIAFGFAKNMNQFIGHTKITVFFVVINEYVIDTAVIQFKYNNIKHKAYYHQNLKSNESIVRFMNFAKGFEIGHINEDMRSTLKTLFDKTLYKPVGGKHIFTTYKQNIDSCVVTGESILIDYIKDFSLKYFSPKSSFICYPLDIVMEGSVHFIRNMARSREQKINISDLFFQRFNYEFRDKYSKCLLKNSFSKKGADELILPLLIDLPIQILIYQDNIIVSQYDFTYLSSQNFKLQCYFTKLKLIIKEFGELDIEIGNNPVNPNYIKGYNFEKIKLDLSNKKIHEENNIIAAIKFKLMDKHEVMKNPSPIDPSPINTSSINLPSITRAKEDLEAYYMTVKKSVENNPFLRGLKLKKMNKELENTAKLLHSNDTEAKLYAHQKLELQRIFEILEK